MADEFQLGNSGNWWNASRNRFETGTAPPSSIPTTLNDTTSFGWPTEMVEMKSRSLMDSGTSSGGSMVLRGGAAAPSSAADVLAHTNLGLSSQGLDWNQSLLSGKSDGNFGSMIQEDNMGTNTRSNFSSEAGGGASSQEQWRHKLYTGASSEDDFKRGFSLNRTQFSFPVTNSNDSTITSRSLTAGFQLDSYGLMLSENQSQGPGSNYPYPSSGYGPNPGHEGMPSWNKFPQFLGSSPPKPAAGGSHLHFNNNTPFWNASAATPAINGSRPSLFPSLQTQIATAPSFDEKPKSQKSTSSETGTTSSKKSSTEATSKRPRNETPSPLPAFKVRKEKMGDRITALQQLVSPFGKTDTASVLSEAIAYIKFLHEQVSVLSNQYMKTGAPILQHKQNSDLKDSGGRRQDLRSRGLCLVPVTSTFPVTHETTVDFWTPTFGGTFR